MTGALFDKGNQNAGTGKRAYVAGIARSMASGLYNRTFGYFMGGASGGAADANDEVDEEEYICVEYLDRQCDIFAHWAAKCDHTIISRAKAKLSLQKSTKHTLDDIELLLKHMEHSGRISVEKISEGATDENTIIKFQT